MQTGRLLKFTFSLLAVCFLNPGAIRSQESSTPSPPAKSPRDGTYPDSADGLQKLLSDLISSLKNGENDRVAGALRNMEVPDCDAWLHRHYPADSADSWMGLCDPKILAVRERELQKQLESFVQQSGRIARVSPRTTQAVLSLRRQTTLPVVALVILTLLPGSCRVSRKRPEESP
jgi:hypothetical protein